MARVRVVDSSRNRTPALLRPEPAADAGGSPWWLLAIFGVALAVRLAVIAQLRGSPFFDVLVGDARQYDAWATTLAGGQWIGQGVFYQTPLYPYLLGLLFAIAGHHVLLVRIVQAVFGASSCVLLAVAGKQFFSARAGLAAGAILAVCGPAVFYDVSIEKSSLDLLLATALLVMLGGFLRRQGWGWLAAAGATTALFMINRENARVLVPVVAVWLLAGPWSERVARRGAWIAVFLSAVGLVLLPVALRNYAVGGEFLISTSQLGPNFYIGNHAGASGVYEPLVANRGEAAFEQADAERLASAAEGRTLTPAEVSSYWLDRGLEFVRHEPAAWTALLARKAAMTVAAAEIADTESIAAYADGSSVLRATSWIHFGVLLPLAVLGVWLTRGDWRRLSVLYASFVAMALAVVVFYVMARYRFPLVPIAALFAGAAVAAWPGLRGRTRQWLPGVALASLVAVGTNGFLRQTDDGTYVNLGAELARDGRPADALPLLERGLAAAPNDARGHFSLGIAENATGQRSRALDEFATAVRLDPADFDAQSSLALALAEGGDLDGALPHFEAAVRLEPDSAEARDNLGQAYSARGSWSQAMAEFVRAVALQPDNAKALSGLGAALFVDGKVEDAIRQFERAATIAPDDFEPRVGLGQAYASEGRTADAVASFEKAEAIAESLGQLEAAAQIRDAIKRLK